MTIDECDALFADIRAATSLTLLTGQFGRLLDAGYAVYRIGLGRGAMFWRARPCGPDGYPNVRDVTYPPAHRAALNRVSAENEPRFYAAARRETALLEQTNCERGQHFHLLGTWVKNGHQIRVLVLGELHHVYKLGYFRAFGGDPGVGRQLNALPRDQGLKAVYIDAFLGSILSDPKARDSDYVRSRALLSVIASRYPVDAVFYPSAKDPLGTNLVITPEAVEQQMVYCASRVARVERRLEFGIIESTLVRQADGIGPSGEFQWNEHADPAREYFFGLTREEYEFSLRNADNRSAIMDLKAFVRRGTAL
jgi:hypothetical protein